MPDSWKITLPCTRAEAEAIDAADDLAIDAVLMTTEETEDDHEHGGSTPMSRTNPARA